MSATFGRRWLGVLTILLIAGTLTSCGRYGSPVRPIPQSGAVPDSPDSLDSPEWVEEEQEAGVLNEP